MVKLLNIAIMTWLACGSLLYAKSARNARGAYVNMLYGPFVYKSDTVNGTDFSNLVGVQVGTNYGKNKEFGMMLHTDRMQTVFRQTDATVDTEFTEFRMNYRNLWFLPTVIFGHGTMKAESTDPAIGEFADLAFIYFGGGLDLEIPYSNMVTVLFKFHTVNFETVYDRTGRDSSFNTRNEIDIGTRFELPISVIYVNTGYLHRSWAADVGGTGAKAQVQTGPYVGLMFGHDF